MYDPLCGVKVVNFMSNIISVRVNETEKEILKKASTLYGCAISSLAESMGFPRNISVKSVPSCRLWQKNMKKKKPMELLNCLILMRQLRN